MPPEAARLQHVTPVMGTMTSAHLSKVSPLSWFMAAWFLCWWCSLAWIVDAAERDGLKSLFLSTGGNENEWPVSEGWDEKVSLDHCQWYGVSCDTTSGNVTTIRLPNNNLSGDLINTANDFWELDSLTILDLSNNSLSGNLPQNFANLISLQVLDLSGNNFSGELPETWLDVEDPTSLPLVHTLPHFSMGFAQLQSLFLSGNSISQDAYTAIQTLLGFPKLSVLDFSRNELYGSIEGAFSVYYCSIGQVDCLVRKRNGGNSLFALFLQDNSINGALPPLQEMGTVLSVFNIEGNRVEGIVPKDYGTLFVGLLARNPSLSSTALPEFLEPITTMAVNESPHEYYLSGSDNERFCFDLGPSNGNLNPRVISLDPSYNDFNDRCKCIIGRGSNSTVATCGVCPFDTYRSTLQVFTAISEECIACPKASFTTGNGSSSPADCVCVVDMYNSVWDGEEKAPVCSPCPMHSTTKGASGAISVSSCHCDPGYYKGSEGQCQVCPAGTYKPVDGNSVSLCIPCPKGTFGNETGAMSFDVCLNCPLGTFSENEGLGAEEDCEPCPAGTYGAVAGLTNMLLCASCPAGTFQNALGVTSIEGCMPCPADTFGETLRSISQDSCLPCPHRMNSGPGSSACIVTDSKDGTLIGVYLLASGIIAVVFTVGYILVSKNNGQNIKDSVHMKLDKDIQTEIKGQQFWISMFTIVEIADLMSDLGAYASLLYTASLIGWIKVLYTVFIVFALVASLHGVYIRVSMLVDMQRERVHGLIISGNRMLYYQKQFHILQQMTRKKRCRKHVPFDRGNRYLAQHIAVQRLISLNSMRMIIAVFEDIPFLALNLFILNTQPKLSRNIIFMASFILSMYVLGYKMTLLEKHSRLKIRKWNLEARMDMDTMINKKATRGRRYSWACTECNQEQQQGSCHLHDDSSNEIKSVAPTCKT